MHGLIFETSIWLLAGSTRYVVCFLCVCESECEHNTHTKRTKRKERRKKKQVSLISFFLWLKLEMFWTVIRRVVLLFCFFDRNQKNKTTHREKWLLNWCVLKKNGPFFLPRGVWKKVVVVRRVRVIWNSPNGAKSVLFLPKERKKRLQKLFSLPPQIILIPFFSF